MEDKFFDKSSEFDTLSAFKKDFPMLGDCKRSIPPFILPETVNGACIIFSTSDKSQFIYSMCAHRIYLLGPSKEFAEHFTKDDFIPWTIEKILNIKDANIVKQDDEYIFDYKDRKYVVFGYKYADNSNSYYYYNIREQ